LKETPPDNNPDDAADKVKDWWLTDFFPPGSRWDRTARCSAYLLIALAVLSGFGYVYDYGVNVYWADDWDTLPAGPSIGRRASWPAA
jgi:hypothetical protein